MPDKTDAEKLSESVNSMYSDSQKQGLMQLAKRQAEEIDRRGQIIMSLEEASRLQQQNLEMLAKQNRDLELLVESLRNERQNLVEEIELLKQKKVETKAQTTKKKKTEEGAKAA